MKSNKDRIIISHEKPPIYDILHNRFGANWDEGLLIAYNGKIHCKDVIQPQKVIHEEVHLKEQAKIGNEVWWQAYLDSPEFRKNEEIKAYYAEAQFVKKHIKDREVRFHMIKDMASNLASSLYGAIISKEDAFELLR